jgi:divalent metal cation (Fe/Co/Zn/Cd) transporter
MNAVRYRTHVFAAFPWPDDRTHVVTLSFAGQWRTAGEQMAVATTAGPEHRAHLVRRGKRLEWLTIAWNGLEALVSLAAGVLAGSVSLVGFGFDSIIELASGTAVLWRMSADADEERRERVERTALRIVGGCFLTLAAYLVADSVKTLRLHEAPESSPVGIAITAASLVVMPMLARAKRNVGKRLGSAAMQADSKQSEFCMWLSAIVLSGLALNAALGIWWADPAAALVMVPIIAREGVEGLQARACRCRAQG